MDHGPTNDGACPSPPGEGPAHDHRCHFYADADDRRCAAASYLGDGRRHGLRVVYVGPGGPDRLRAELRALPGADRDIDRGAVRLVDPAELYGPPPIDPDAVLTRCRGLVDGALGDGYGGVRLFADASGLVGDAQDHDAFARYELRLGPVVGTFPLSAMCAYDARLPRRRLRDLASVHPAGSGRHASFRLTLDALGMPRLTGEVDAADRGAFLRAVARLSAAPGEELVVDCSGARFVDHRAVMVLDAHGAAQRRPVVLLAPPPVVGRVVALLGLRHVQVVGT